MAVLNVGSNAKALNAAVKVTYVSLVENGSNDSLKSITEHKPKAGVMLLSKDEKKKKFLVVCRVSSELVDMGLHANDWALQTAKVGGGKGGGRSPDNAQVTQLHPLHSLPLLTEGYSFVSFVLLAVGCSSYVSLFCLRCHVCKTITLGLWYRSIQV